MATPALERYGSEELKKEFLDEFIENNPKISKSKKLDFIDAPVSGGQAGAENGALSIMCGGDETVYNFVEPILGGIKSLQLNYCRKRLILKTFC